MFTEGSELIHRLFKGTNSPISICSIKPVWAMGGDQDVDSEEEILTGSLKPFQKRTAASKAAENASEGLVKPKPKAKATPRASATGKTCVAEGCSEHCCNGKPDCAFHNPAWDNMRYQAVKKKDKEGDKEVWELWMELNKPENRIQLIEKR